MELSLYATVIKRWFLLILAGTILATAIGTGVEYKSRLAASTASFQSTASVQVNCTAPCGYYVGGGSTTDAENTLLPRVKDAAATQGSSARSAPANCSSVNAFIDPVIGDIKVEAAASTAVQARLCANRAARYLTRTQDGKVEAQAQLAIKSYKRLQAIAKQRWLHFVRLLVLTPKYKHATRAKLTALENNWEYELNSYHSTITSFRFPAISAATAFPAHGSIKYTGKPLSPFKSIVPAAILGFVLSFLLAAWFESRRKPVTQDAAAVQPSVNEHLPVDATYPTSQVATIESEVSESISVAPVEEEVQSIPVEAFSTSADRRSETMIALAEPMQQTAELIARLVDSARPSIFVTSPTSSEPKSESAAGLAAALASSGKRVVLVDADPNAQLTKFFGLNDRPGLTDFLGYPQGPLHQLVHPANLAASNGSLWVLPYGVRRLEPSSFPYGSASSADSQGWGQALSQLASSGVIVIVDGPVVLEAPSLLDATAQMGGVIVALQRERSGPDVTQTYEVLRARGARLLGVVANPTMFRLAALGDASVSQRLDTHFSARTGGGANMPSLGSDNPHPATDPFQRR